MVPEVPETKQVCLNALKLGYCHIDTAHAYENERSVGAAVRESGILRDEIWVTYKLRLREYGEGKTMVGINKMLERLNIGYIDLLLFHQQVECHPYYQQDALKKRLAPYGTVIESWYPIGHGAPGLINQPIFTE